ncbi:nucleotidyltransferase domain-containing protein [Euzebya tangerina]|uniref:nucleotidyltransferase domain-containing protein n=1 Tax=Euzebya tangerina TaxID=591198 RepID=UPI000E30C79E|nr:nucleotidyltransferase domain-containing protein [Euzebya tangerina]
MTPTDEPREALRRLLDAERSGSLDALAHRHDLNLIVAFGSALREGPAADLDLAVGHGGTMNVLALLEDLYQLTGSEKIDVLDLNRAGTVPRSEALGPGRLIWERDVGAFAEAQMVTLAMLWDTQWLRDLELEQLAQ